VAYLRTSVYVSVYFPSIVKSDGHRLPSVVGACEPHVQQGDAEAV
jgi:hypothetical protein